MKRKEEEEKDEKKKNFKSNFEDPKRVIERNFDAGLRTQSSFSLFRKED